MEIAMNGDLYFESFALITSKRKQRQLDYRRLKHFDVLSINGENSLIVTLKSGEINIQYYFITGKLFSMPSKTHTKVSSGGRTSTD